MSHAKGKSKRIMPFIVFTPKRPLNHWVQECWQLNVPEGRYDYRSVPDNCIDLIINLTDPTEIFIVSPFSMVQVFEMTGPVTYFGIRFRPLQQQSIISLPTGGWYNADNVINAADLLSTPLLNALRADAYKRKTFQARCLSLSAVLLDVLQHRELDPRLQRYIQYCLKNITSRINLSDKQCAKFGVSARQLRRLTALQLGLTPRDFAKVLRFQHALRSMIFEDNVAPWAQSYYDQPHFIRDFKGLTGVTPNEFERLSVLYNTQ